MRIPFVFALILGACTASVAPSPTPSTTSTALPTPAPAAACAPAMRPLTWTDARIELLPHAIGPTVVFGLDGAFLASAYAYPLGANRHWFTLDSAGARTGQFDWDVGWVLQSPDGAQITYGARDPATGEVALHVRDLVGVARVVRVGGAVPYAWADAFRVLTQPDVDPNVIHAIDTRTLVDEVVFRPPAVPPGRASGDEEWFPLSGDLRWALFERFHADGSFARSDLFDVLRQTYVPAALPARPAWLAPRGDLMTWIDGRDLRAMHLCDRRAVTLATLPATNAPLVDGMRWSADARFLSLEYGPTDDLHGPELVVIADLERGAITALAAPWGYVRRWSPDDEYVILSRRGYHGSVDRLARLTLR